MAQLGIQHKREISQNSQNTSTTDPKTSSVGDKGTMAKRKTEKTGGKGNEKDGDESPSKKFSSKNFGSPVRQKPVWGNWLEVLPTLVEWLWVVLLWRSDKPITPYLKPLEKKLEGDEGELHSELGIACITDRKGDKDEFGNYGKMPKGPGYDSAFAKCIIAYSKEENVTADELGKELAEKLTDIVNKTPEVSHAPLCDSA